MVLWLACVLVSDSLQRWCCFLTLIMHGVTLGIPSISSFQLGLSLKFVFCGCWGHALVIMQANKLNISCLITFYTNNYLPLTPSWSSKEGGYFSIFQFRMLAYAIQPIKRRFKNDRHFKALWNQSCWTAIQSPVQHKHVNYPDFLHAPLSEWVGYFTIWRLAHEKRTNLVHSCRPMWEMHQM